MMSHSAFDLIDTYVQLADGPRAVPVQVGEDFWATIDDRPEHRGIVHQPGDALLITRGAGTQHRPV